MVNTAECYLMWLLKTLVRNEQEAGKSLFKLELFTEPQSQYRTNPLRLKLKTQHDVSQVTGVF